MQGNGRAYGKVARRLWGKYAVPPPREPRSARQSFWEEHGTTGGPISGSKLGGTWPLKAPKRKSC